MSISCHFQIQLAISELQLTLPYVLYVLDVKSAVALKWQVGFENCIKMTPIFTIIFNSKMLIKSALHTVENPGNRKVRFCTKVQSSQISKLLGIFQNQKMDIISCHDCQFVKCKSQINKLAWFDFKYKKVHIHRI